MSDTIADATPDTMLSQLLFRMPSLGADMEAGTVLEWRVAPGDEVAPGDVVALVDTEKAEIEVEIFDAGVIDAIDVPVGVEVAVGTTLAHLRPVGSSTAAGAGRAVPALTTPAAAAAVSPSVPVPLPVVVPVSDPGRAAVPAPQPVPCVLSPLVRRLANELHVDLEHLRGTGVGGRVTRSDVERAVSRRRISPRARRLAAVRGIDLASVERGRRGGRPCGAVVGDDVLASGAPAGGGGGLVAPPPAGATAPSRFPERSHPPEPPSGNRMRAAIASSMTRSWREIPHYHVSTRIDLSPALRWLDDRNAAASTAQRVLPSALLLHAIAVSARRHPEVNGWWVDGGFRPAAAVDLGVAVALRGGGLATPTITGADALDLDELMGRLQEVVTRARRGRLRSSDMAAASLTVTNLGDLGVDAVSGIIHPPQVGLVGLGAVHDEPWALNGLLGVRSVVHATFAGDHRASDGLAGAAFLRTLGSTLQEPDGAAAPPTRTPGGNARS